MIDGGFLNFGYKCVGLGWLDCEGTSADVVIYRDSAIEGIIDEGIRFAYCFVAHSEK